MRGNGVSGHITQLVKNTLDEIREDPSSRLGYDVNAWLASPRVVHARKVLKVRAPVEVEALERLWGLDSPPQGDRDVADVMGMGLADLHELEARAFRLLAGAARRKPKSKRSRTDAQLDRAQRRDEERWEKARRLSEKRRGLASGAATLAVLVNANTDQANERLRETMALLNATKPTFTSTN